MDASKLDFGAHPAIKAVAVIKELLSHSVCGNPIEGRRECLVHSHLVTVMTTDTL